MHTKLTLFSFNIDLSIIIGRMYMFVVGEYLLLINIINEQLTPPLNNGKEWV